MTDEKPLVQTTQPFGPEEETLFLLSIPGMCASIREGMKEPLSESAKNLDWETP